MSMAPSMSASFQQHVARMVLSATFFAVMALFTKRVALRIPGAEVALIRFLVGGVVAAAVLLGRGARPVNRGGLVLRGLFGGVAVLFYFQAIQHLPVGIASLLNYTAPVFTALFAWLFLGERIGLGLVAALALTLGGLSLVLAGSAPAGSLRPSGWHLIGVASAVLAGAAVTTIRHLRRTDGAWEIFASFCCFGVLVTLPESLLHWVWPCAAEWLELGVVGVTAVAGQILMTHSMRFLTAAVSGIVLQLTPVLALAFGFLFLDERLGPLALLGAAATLAGVVWTGLLEARVER
jgi:drug/metabolite transporter (DMT)-like permease